MRLTAAAAAAALIQIDCCGTEDPACEKQAATPAAAGALAPDAEEVEAAGAPGIGPETTLDSLQPLWGADPRWQVLIDP